MGIVVVKVGGSIASQPLKLHALCIKLSELSKKRKLVVVPGGGEFADTVRQLDQRFHLSEKAAHRMAILGMDQYGLLLVDLIPDSTAVVNLEETENALSMGKVPVFLPSALLFMEDPLENSWEITSDCIALYLATRMKASKVLLVTNVDGIYSSDPKKNNGAEFMRKVTPNELLALKQRTSVDKALPELLLKSPIECYVVNGLYPHRLEAILEGQETVSTFIGNNSF